MGLSIVRNDRRAHHWLSAPSTQLQQAASSFYRDDARRSDGTGMPSRAGDTQYPSTPPIIFCFLHPIFYFYVRVIMIMTQNQFLLSEARFCFRCGFNRASSTVGAQSGASYSLS